MTHALMTDADLDALRQDLTRQLNFLTLREFRIIARAIESAYDVAGLQSAIDANAAAFDLERAERIKAQADAKALAEVGERLQVERVPLTDAGWLEYLLKHADTSTLDLAAFRGDSIQTRGLWVLRVPSNNLRKLVESAHGITPGDRVPNTHRSTFVTIEDTP